MKYLKSILLCIGLLLILNLIITILSYFDLLNNTKILKIISFIITFIITGIYTGLNSKNKAYLEGLKVSSLFILLSIIVSIIIPSLNVNLKTIIYYLLLCLLTVLGSTIGINHKQKK